MLFAIPALTVQYPVLAGNFLGMADGPILRPESTVRHRLPTPIGALESHCFFRILCCVSE